MKSYRRILIWTFGAIWVFPSLMPLVRGFLGDLGPGKSCGMDTFGGMPYEPQQRLRSEAFSSLETSPVGSPRWNRTKSS